MALSAKETINVNEAIENLTKFSNQSTYAYNSPLFENEEEYNKFLERHNMAKVETLPLDGYVQEAVDWVKNVFVPRLRSLPEIWNTIKGTNWLEHLTAALTGLCAGAGVMATVKKAGVRNEMREEVRKDIRGLGR